jgi:formylmethanofuran dehydrogenase subunit B
MNRIPCSGCSLLCDDIFIRSDGFFIDQIVGACKKGKERFDQVTSKNRITSPLIKKNGENLKVNWDEALDKTVELIKNSKNPILYGFSNSSCEAQFNGIQLAKKIDGFIDSNSTICQGKILNASSYSNLTLTTLSEIINKADLLIFWGLNAAESIPRLLNKALFSRGKFRMTGREIKTLIIIDPVQTASFGVMGVRDLALLIEPGKDLDLIRILKKECCDEVSIPSNGIAGLDKDDLKRLLLNLREAENNVIFIGQGVISSPSSDELIKELLELVELIENKQQRGRTSIIMAGGHYNMAGFDQVSLSSTGSNQNLQFSNGKLVNSQETIISKINKEDFDYSIIVGTDPISHFPKELSKKLMSKPIIVIDNHKSATTQVADIVLPTAITGIECEGLAYRLDHVPVQLQKLVDPPSNLLSDEALLKKIIMKLGDN